MDQTAPAWKLWIYTNYDCNLACSYCVARSTPRTPRQAFGLAAVQQAVDEARQLNVGTILFTGGEPFLLPDIYAMLAYSMQWFETVVLTNGMLFTRSRMEKLIAIASERLIVQVSLDGAQAAHHDTYRGKHSWGRTMAGIKKLLDAGLYVRLASTQTPANAEHMHELCALHHSLGIPESEHIIRPLARRGFSNEGLELTLADMAPEVTLTHDGVYWHPLGPEEDLRVSHTIFPLADAFACIEARQAELRQTQSAPAKGFT